MKFSAVLPDNITNNETIVLPISMSQPLERGERLAAILKKIEDQGYKDRTTILICDYLNRHNCTTDIEALLQGDSFIDDHKEILDGFKIIKWKEYIQSKCEFSKRLEEITNISNDNSRFYNRIKKTWEKCLSTSQALSASIKYQREEYAAILCMNDFNHLFYPKRITNGMAYLYNFVAGEKPTYHHVKLSELKKQNENCPSSQLIALDLPLKKDRRHIHISFRVILDQIDVLLRTDELSLKSKKIFSEEAENIFMGYGLVDEKPNQDNQMTETIRDYNSFYSHQESSSTQEIHPFEIITMGEG